jgi:hypothetical protein
MELSIYSFAAISIPSSHPNLIKELHKLAMCPSICCIEMRKQNIININNMNHVDDNTKVKSVAIDNNKPISLIIFLQCTVRFACEIKGRWKS